METYVFSLDLNKVCRICLCEDTQMFSIFSEIYEDETSSEELPCLNEIISSLSSMKVFKKKSMEMIGHYNYFYVINLQSKLCFLCFIFMFRIDFIEEHY